VGEPGVGPKIDVSQIELQAIPEGVFPAAYPRADFRVCLTPSAHQDILAHSRTDTSIELCGVLVGRVFKDSFGPFAVIEDIVRGENAENRGAQVTFTHATWAHVFREMEEKYPDKRIVGWYHTHPGFGIFLSPMDMFIQENFFNLPWQTAFVVDPLSGGEGLFVWRDGKAAPATQYWVGEDVRIARPRATHVAKPLAEVLAPEPQPLSAAKPATLRTRSVAWDVVQVTLLAAILLALLFEPQVRLGMERLLSFCGRLLCKGRGG